MNAAVMTSPTETSAANDKSSARPRRAVVPPKRILADMSVFDYLSQCQPPLVDKIIDIACAQTKVPPELRRDAGQEISLMWSQLVPDTAKFKPGQIAAYAHQMARHAALRTRRDLGSSVRLPGSAFRKRKDGSSYVTPGVLAAALDWNEMESWFQSEEAGNATNGAAALRDDFGQVSLTDAEAPLAEDAAEEALLAERLAQLEANKDVLTPRQYSIMAALVDGSTYEEVMAQFGIKKGVLMREVSIAATTLGPLSEF